LFRRLRSRPTVRGWAFVDRGGYRQTGTQSAERGCIIIELNANRDALHNLGEISRRVLRRQHIELGARCRREAGDTAAEHLAGQYVGLDRSRQSRPHSAELTFFEVGVDPQAARRHHRHQLRTDRGVAARPRTAIADRAVDRSAKLGVSEVQLGEVAVGHGLRQCRLCLLLLRVDDVQSTLRSHYRSARLIGSSGRLFMVSSAC
jgi:hypothetical protein